MQPQRHDLAGWSNVPLPRAAITILVNRIPLDLTGTTARMQVRTRSGVLVADISGPSAYGIEYVNAAAGAIIPHVGWVDMMAAWGAAAPKAGADAQLAYDLVITDADDLEQARLEGTFTVRAGVTVPGGFALADPPFGDDSVDFSRMIPSSAQPVVAARTPDNALIIRCLTDTGILEEYVKIDPAGYKGVDGGYQFVSHRALVGSQLYSWFRAPEDDDTRTIEEAALRVHDVAHPYSTGLDGTGGAYGGYGHGYWLNTPANNQITIDTAPHLNLQDLANWPVGTIIRGSSLVIACPFRQVYFGTSTEAVSITLTDVFDNQGWTSQADVQAIRPDAAWQDSTCPMFACTSSAQVDTAKLQGYAAIPLVGDGAQKGNWNGVPGTSPVVMQFYAAANNTVICQKEALAGPPMRENGVNVSPAWRDNLYGRVHVSDAAAVSGNPAYAKFRMYLNSSEQVPPRTSWPMDPADVFTSIARRRTVIRPGGPL